MPGFQKWSCRLGSILTATLLSLSLYAPLTLANELAANSDEFARAVEAYRQGQYLQAEPLFTQLHRENPKDARILYYLAITEAQLGRFQKARTHYETIIREAPQSEAAMLATEGLSYLPADSQALDHPPRFQGPGSSSQGSFPTQQANTSGNSWGNMNPQEWMAMQMMMSQFGGNATNNGMGGMGMMPWMMMSQPGGSNDPNNPGIGAGGFQMDPNVMSNLLMNQMMQNFSLDGPRDDQR